MKKRIHVSQLNIRKNLKTGSREPVFTVVTSKWTRKGHSIRIDGPSELVYSPDKPLSCGARLWIETNEPIILDAEWIQ